MSNNFIEVILPDEKMTRFKNRFAERQQARVKHAIKTQESAAGYLLLFEIINQINKQELVDTGAYRASWHLMVQETSTKVSTDHPAARRLEYGFAGVDTMGRLYNQPARPHVRPALAVVREKMRKSTVEAILKELNS